MRPLRPLTHTSPFWRTYGTPPGLTKRRSSGDLAGAYAFYPRFQALSLTVPQQHGKLLHELIGDLKRRVNLPQEDQLCLLGRTQRLG
jgi:hypothetical protein